MDDYFCMTAQPRSLATKNGAKIMQVAMGGRRRHQARWY
jgi:hypothetical protein